MALSFSTINCRKSQDAFVEIKEILLKGKPAVIAVQENPKRKGNPFKGSGDYLVPDTDKGRAAIVVSNSIEANLIPQLCTPDIAVALAVLLGPEGKKRCILIVSYYSDITKPVDSTALESIRRYSDTNGYEILMGGGMQMLSNE